MSVRKEPAEFSEGREAHHRVSDPVRPADDYSFDGFSFHGISNQTPQTIIDTNAGRPTKLSPDACQIRNIVQRNGSGQVSVFSKYWIALNYGGNTFDDFAQGRRVTWTTAQII